jgi:hypothetical protein
VVLPIPDWRAASNLSPLVSETALKIARLSRSASCKISLSLGILSRVRDCKSVGRSHVSTTEPELSATARSCGLAGSGNASMLAAFLIAADVDDFASFDPIDDDGEPRQKATECLSLSDVELPEL